MAWDEDMVTMLRGTIQDYATDTDAAKYTDARLTELILIASQNVLTQAKFKNEYVVSLSNGTLRPDPTSSTTKDNSFINLVTMKAAAMLATAEIREYTAQGISIRDGSSAISLQRSAAGMKLMQDMYNKAYEDGLYEFQTTGTTGGTVVLSAHGSECNYPYNRGRW